MSAIRQKLALILSLGMALAVSTGCTTSKDFIGETSLYAKSDYPWELELYTDANITNITQATGGMRAVIKLRHPTINDGKPLMLYVEDSRSPRVTMTKSSRDGRVIKTETGWGLIGRMRDYSFAGFMYDYCVVWNLLAYAVGLKPDDWEIQMVAKNVDFTTVEDCKSYCEPDGSISDREIAMNEAGLVAWINMGDRKRHTLYIYIRHVTLNGKKPPEGCLEECRRGILYLR